LPSRFSDRHDAGGAPALASGDRDRGVADPPDGWCATACPHEAGTGPDGLRAFYELLFSNRGGIPLEHCAILDDERACALQYNAVRWGQTELPAQAGVAVYVRGQSGKLAAARIYDVVNPPLGSPS
jgi:hypothetical protein